MKRRLLAALFCLAPFGADAQKAQYTNPDGSSSPGVVIACPNGNSSTTCPGLAAGALAPAVNSGTSSAVLKASSGTLYDVYLTNDTVKDLWLLVFNATSLPGNGATTTGTASGNLQDCVRVPAGTTGTISYDPFVPESFSIGITAVASSTKCTTLTADTTALMIHGRAQ